MDPIKPELYQEKILPMLAEHFQYANIMQAPRLSKIVLNVGVGEGPGIC